MTKNKSITPQETFQMMECGNLDLNFPISYGTLLLGNTKAGKTTIAHFLMHQVLQGGYNDQKSVVYKLKDGLKQYMGAKIGDQEAVSETQIPNFFTFDKTTETIGGIEITQQKYLIDCPGYLDTFGCFRIITNRFFHFQVFSKVQNIKFIITLNYYDMTRTAEGLKQTFKEFLKGFTNLDKIKSNIFNATCVMITAVPQDQDLENVRERFKATTIGGEFEKIYVEFRDDLVGNNVETSKIFIFKAAKLGVKCDKQNKVLSQINKKTKYWHRTKNQDGDVDMQNICISIAQYLQKDQESFKCEMKSLGKYYQDKIQKDLSTLVSLLKMLIIDTQNGQQSFNCITQMLKYNAQMEQQRKNYQGVCQFLYKKYEYQRKQLKDKLFKPHNLFESQSSVTSSEIPFWLCKIQALMTIEDEVQKIIKQNQEIRQIENIKAIQKAIKKVLNILVSLFTAKKDKKQQKDANYIKIINYVYNIYRVIDNSNKLFELISLSINKNKKANSLEVLQNGMYFILISYPYLLKSIFLKSLQKSWIQIFGINITNWSIQDNLTIKGSQQVHKFLIQYKNILNNPQILQDKIQKRFNQQTIHSLKQLINFKIAKIKSNSFVMMGKQGNLTLQSITEILDAIKQNQQKIYQSAHNAFDNQSLKVQNIRNIGILAQCLHKNKKFYLALQLYDCIGDAYKIFEVLNQKREERKKKKIDDSIEDLMEYVQKAKKYHRTNLAIEKAQQALHLAQDSANLEKTNYISATLKHICSDQLQDSDAYLNFLENPISDVEIPPSIYEKIRACIPNRK